MKTAPQPAEVAGLLALAASRPQEGLARARAVLAGQPGPLDASIAHHAAGFVLREFGDLDAATRELRAALRAARLARSPGREANVLAALGVALVYAGQTRAGMAAFDQAAGLARGADLARIQHRRAIALWTLGRYPEALADLRSAVTTLRRAGDTIWPAARSPPGHWCTCPRATPAGPSGTWTWPNDCTPGPARSSRSPTWCTTGPSWRSGPGICPPRCASWTRRHSTTPGCTCRRLT